MFKLILKRVVYLKKNVYCQFICEKKCFTKIRYCLNKKISMYSGFCLLKWEKFQEWKHYMK